MASEFSRVKIEFGPHRTRTKCQSFFVGLVPKMIKHSHSKQNKIIVESKAKCEWILSHTCRHSFCTNEFLAGTPVERIMKISGHKSVRDFYRYIRVSPEEAARKIQELWNALENHSPRD